MKPLWGHLKDLFNRQRKATGAVDAGLVFAGAVRALLFQKQHRELLRLEIFDKYLAASEGSDVLFHLSHRYYLSTTFTQRERIECALTHYRFEGGRYDGRYKDMVYRDGGLTLWSRTVGPVAYALKLRDSADLRHEGGISVVLCAGDVCLCEMSYAWVDADVLGMGTGTILFITRNQSVKQDAPDLLRFRQAFPQNSPAYFCLAALYGIAIANGSDRIAAIRQECQVAFEERYAPGFRNSYSEFWKSFGAFERGDVAHELPVPLVVPPLAQVKAKHRKRAMERRRHWAEISFQAEQTLVRHVQPASAVESRCDRRGRAENDAPKPSDQRRLPTSIVQ